MRAVLCEAFDGPDALSVSETADPVVSAGQVIIDVAAASLNFPDVLITHGKYQFKPPLPFTPGGEGAGTVRAVGEGVTHLAVGDRVLFMTQIGAFAEQISIPAMMVVPMPSSMSFEEAASLTITYATTIHALKDRADLKPGERLLVLGAAGGVGQAAIELGKHMGAEVTACASTAEKLETCADLGADHLVNYAEADFKTALKAASSGKRFDVVYDPVGGDFTETAFRSLAPGGRHLVIGFAAGKIPEIPINLCLLKQASLVGVFWGTWAMANPALQSANMKALFDAFEAGHIKPRIHASYPLDDIKTAYADLTGRKAIGKVVVTP